MFWFAKDAFRNLASPRLVVYGTRDFVGTDACMTAGAVDVPTCRGDAHTAKPEQSTLLVVPGYEHSNFSCAQPEVARARLAVIQRQMGDWIVKVTK